MSIPTRWRYSLSFSNFLVHRNVFFKLITWIQRIIFISVSFNIITIGQPYVVPRGWTMHPHAAFRVASSICPYWYGWPHLVSSPVFNVSIITESFPVSFAFFSFLSAACTSLDIVCGTTPGCVCIVTAWSLSHYSEYNSSIRTMIISCSESLNLVCPGVLSSGLCIHAPYAFV